MFPIVSKTEPTYRKACVTGGAGFIGSQLTSELLSRGLHVTVLDNLSTGLRANVPAGVPLVAADLLDSDACAHAVEGCDIVFHLAARVAIRSSFEFAVEDTQTNVCGTASLMKAVARQRTVRKVIAASSMGVYADNVDATPIPETHLTDPASPYGISKLALEQLTHKMAAASGIESTVLRLFNTYGPGQRLSPYVGVITIFVNALKEGRAPVIFGDGNQSRDFVHVKDVVSGFLAAMDSASSGDTFNIGTGVPHTVNQVFRVLANVLGSAIEPAYADAVPGELRFSIADITKARTRLSYCPKYVLEDSIGAVVEEMIGTAASISA